MLIVASPTTSLLSTSVPVPHDGQPQWLRCTDSECGWRQDPWCARSWCDNDHRGEPDGPFPFTVAVWSEVRVCQPCGEPPESHLVGIECDGYIEKVGAIVALVEVTGPSHKAEDCRERVPVYSLVGGAPEEGEGYCHPDALPDCWHTPVGEVTRLAVPVPCERPRMCGCPSNCGKTADEAKRESVASPGMFNRDQCEAMVDRMAFYPDVWVADAALADRLRKVTT